MNPSRSSSVRSQSILLFVSLVFSTTGNAQLDDVQWPMHGGSLSRNMVSTSIDLDFDFDLTTTDQLLWKARLGSQTYGSPIVTNKYVFVSTNNEGSYHANYKGDHGCLLCFDSQTGEFRWQLTRKKLKSGRANDMPYNGMVSSPCVEGQRLWVVTNRCELMCLDTEGFFDDNNDGPFKDEYKTTDQTFDRRDADIVWRLDMMEELGVYPHNMSTSSPLVYGDLVYVVTSNGVGVDHGDVYNPDAPSFLAVNKRTGKVEWTDNSPGENVLHGQWGSPSIGVVNGKPQVYFPGGDGWLYALDALTGEQIWKFDLNPKESKWHLSGGTRNNVVCMPVFYDDSVIVGVGQDPEHGNGVGALWRIDATQSGDVSDELGDKGEPGRPNPNSAVIWHYGGVDADGSVTGSRGEAIFRRTLSTVAISNGLVFAADLSGFVHCVDLKTGKRCWQHDTLSAIWGSPMYADDHLLVGDEDGVLTILKAASDLSVVKKLETPSYFSIYSTPTVVNGVLYLTDRKNLYVFRLGDHD